MIISLFLDHQHLEPSPSPKMRKSATVAVATAVRKSPRVRQLNKK